MCPVSAKSIETCDELPCSFICFLILLSSYYRLGHKKCKRVSWGQKRWVSKKSYRKWLIFVFFLFCFVLFCFVLFCFCLFFVFACLFACFKWGISGGRASNGLEFPLHAILCPSLYKLSIIAPELK